MWFMSTQTIRSELDRTDAAIRAAGYTGRIDFRPPYGKKLVGLPLELQRRGTRTITWDVSSEDFTPGVVQTPEQISDGAMDQVRPGSIILLHPMNGRTATQQAAGLLIDRLTADGYRFVTVDQLIGL